MARVREKGRKNSPLYVVSRSGSFNKDIQIGVEERQANLFYIIAGGEIQFRIYSYRDQWFLWIEKLSFSIPVSNFTTALQVVERELT